MKRRLVKNFVVEIRKRRGRKSKRAEGTIIARAFERLQLQPSLSAKS